MLTCSAQRRVGSAKHLAERRREKAALTGTRCPSVGTPRPDQSHLTSDPAPH